MRVSFCVFYSNFSRLDKFISKTFNLGRRKVSTLFLEGRVFLNRKKAKKSQSFKKGDLVEIDFFNFSENFEYSEIEVLEETDDYIAFYKPSGLHSQKIFRNAYSLEDFIEKNFGENVRLLSRLDFYSQGIVVASKKLEFYNRYKELESEKQIEKMYFTFVRGKVLSEFTVRKEIDYRKRKVVKVLEKESDIFITHIRPLEVYSNFSVVLAKIFKGARHQIRAHLSWAGFPLVGDFVYGDKDHLDFFLFCFYVKSKELGLHVEINERLKEKANKFLKILLNQC